METVNALGRRKEAVARVYVNEGAGKIVINGRDIETYFPSSILRYIVLQPLNKLGVAEKYDIKVTLDGGGFKGQAEALRLAIARALVKINPEDKAALKAEGFMVTLVRLSVRNRVSRRLVSTSSSVNVNTWNKSKLCGLLQRITTQLSLFNKWSQPCACKIMNVHACVLEQR